ncbi:calmodulin-like protein [Musa troglodytarum]|uniref:Calmodulin-like protein n=1 Tax=Musa troglodytarum TaxID=320322 RepID=A0A9E7HRB3_9LILI|nr:calmodulin-like protein [Musa troglodytarum]
MGKIRSLFRRHRPKPQPGHPADPSAADPGNLERVFNKFDSNGDGKISSAELADVLESLGIGEGASVAQCRRMIDGVDLDGDGLISFEEFKTMMTAGGCNAQAFAAFAAAK